MCKCKTVPSTASVAVSVVLASGPYHSIHTSSHRISKNQLDSPALVGQILGLSDRDVGISHN